VRGDAQTGPETDPLWTVSLTNCTAYACYTPIRLQDGNTQLTVDKSILGGWNAAGFGIENDDQKVAKTNLEHTTVTNSIFVNADLTACYKTGTTPTTETNAIKTVKAWIADDRASVFCTIDPAARVHYLMLNAYGPAVNIDGASHNAGSKAIGGNVPVELSVFSVE